MIVSGAVEVENGSVKSNNALVGEVPGKIHWETLAGLTFRTTNTATGAFSGAGELKGGVRGVNEYGLQTKVTPSLAVKGILSYEDFVGQIGIENVGLVTHVRGDLLVGYRIKPLDVPTTLGVGLQGVYNAASEGPYKDERSSLRVLFQVGLGDRFDLSDLEHITNQERDGLSGR